MAKKKKIELPASGIDVNALGVSFGKTEKPKRQGRSCLTNLMFIMIAIGFLGYIGSLQTPKNKPVPTATQSKGQAFQALPEDTSTPRIVLTSPIIAEASATISDTAQPIIIIAPTKAEPTAQTIAVRDTSSKTYYASSGGTNIRSCPKTSCLSVTKIAAGDAIVTTGQVDGDAVNVGNAVWYRVQYKGEDAYVYSGVVKDTKPAVVSSGSSGGVTTSSSSSTVVIQQSVAPSQVWDCSGDVYNCGSFGSRAEMNSYWAACPGDPSNLDGNDDGSYCES